MSNKIFISAGDSSGDLHAAQLMKHIRESVPDVSFVGFGGSEMLAQGLESIVPLSSISVVGFWEVFRHLGFFNKLMKQCEDILRDGVSAFIPVDYPGFNLRLALKAKQLGIPVAYFIAPQLWAWGKNRARKLAISIDMLLVVFPFEEDFFRRYGIETHYIGHPLMDQPALSQPVAGYDERSNTIAFFPGSRRQEIERHLPLLEGIRKELQPKLKDFDFTIAKSPLLEADEYKHLLRIDSGWQLEDSRYKLIGSSLAGLVKTGTSNLEAMLLGLPFAMFYKTSAITYFLGKHLINLDYLSITNILSGKLVVKEFIQRDANPAMISKEIAEIALNRSYWEEMQSRLLAVRSILGGSGASKRAADIIVEKLNLK
jgi:lipid-A-disaccharide synthase